MLCKLDNWGYTRINVGRDSSVGTATRYGLGASGIGFRWRREFPHPSRPALWSTQLPINGYRVSLPGIKRPGRGANHPLPSSTVMAYSRANFSSLLTHLHTGTNPTELLWMSNQPVAAVATYTTHNKHKGRTSMPPARLDSAILAHLRFRHDGHRDVAFLWLYEFLNRVIWWWILSDERLND